jgi:hypothetical protein
MLTKDQEIARSVAENGWHAISVTDCFPSFVYTCGLLTTFQHPELVVFGLEQHTAYSTLAVMVESLRNGQLFTQIGTYNGVLDEWSIAVRRVHPTQFEIYLGYSMAHCRHMGNPGGLAALQVFWPDKQGRFPYESDCDLKVCQLPPRLDLEVSPSELSAFHCQYGT